MTNLDTSPAQEVCPAAPEGQGPCVQLWPEREVPLGGVRAMNVKRQHVALKKDALKDVKDETGVQDFKDDKNIAADRCASWMDGRFLQGTFTGTRVHNDEKPDVTFEGTGGLSGLRSLTEYVNIAMADGSVRALAKPLSLETWKRLTARNDGNPIPNDF